jgi:membrane protease YdiL (CAAX protease family)
MLGYFKSLFVNTWTETEKFSIENNSTFKQKFVNVNSLIILIYIAFGLTIVRYYGRIDTIIINSIGKHPGKLGTLFINYFFSPGTGEFRQKIWWVGIIIIIYLVIPVLIVKLVFKHKLSDYGIRFKNIQKDYPLYIFMMLIMMPLVYFASMTVSFQQRYPIFHPLKNSLFPVFIWWQAAYFLQFVAVEFFFRGFILHGLKNRFGFYAIFISMIPYCMVHFGKPFGETIAAIFAGLILGTLSLKSRSIVLGIIIHYSVAITMDIFALYREGLIK